MGLFLKNTLELALISAPWLPFGLVAAGSLRAWLPMDLVGRSLGGSGLAPVARAALIGAPLPLCSCGTLPAAMSLRRSGASRASTTSFLISTPETGVDSVALSWVLLGPYMAVLRPVSAIISAISAGLLVGRTEASVSPESAPEETPALATAEDCGSASCCARPQTPTTVKTQRPGFWRRTLDGLKYAFTDLLDDLALWLAVGIAVAGLVVTLVPPDMLSGWGSGLGAMLLVMVISVPMYVCATASTPLAHAMLFAGVSPGTVLVFLLAGPASNLASLALVRRELGGRALVAYLFGVGGVSILLGLGLDTLIGATGLDLLAGIADVGTGDHELPVILSVLSLLILVIASVKPFRRYLTQGKAGEDGSCCD